MRETSVTIPCISKVGHGSEDRIESVANHCPIDRYAPGRASGGPIYITPSHRSVTYCCSNKIEEEPNS